MEAYPESDLRTVHPFLCRLCLALIDHSVREGRLLFNKCCPGFRICGTCLETRKVAYAKGSKPVKACPNPDCKNPAFSVFSEKIYLEDKFLSSKYIILKNQHRVPDFRFKHDQLVIGFIPNGLVTQYFTNIFFDQFEFNWLKNQDCKETKNFEAISQVELVTDSYGLLGEKQLIIRLQKPFFFTRVLLQLLGQTLDFRGTKYKFQCPMLSNDPFHDFHGFHLVL